MANQFATLLSPLRFGATGCDGFAERDRPNCRTPPRTAFDDRSFGRQGRHDHAERRSRHDPYPGASRVGETSERRGQSHRRAGLFQRGLSVSEDAYLSAADLRCIRPTSHVLGHGYHEDALFLAPMRDNVYRGVALALTEPDKQLIMGDALCAWWGWNRAA